ncbi:MAG: glycosyl hydrolase [Flavobacteriaceae bacterium]|nr:glycosyl hydrolase [Flavobacteriaceae bacterium]
MKTIFQFLFLFISISLFAQQSVTNTTIVKKAIQEKEAFTKNSIIKNIAFTNIGPTIMSGRVVDIDVNPENTAEFYVGYASGGLWYTDNNGTTFTPVLDNSPTQNIGDIATDWKNGTIWVGTGESNSSRSSYSGIGILKSTDKGKTWKNVGLTDSHHIGRIIINKNNPNEVVIGVIGHLYSANKERGIYKTTDGGKTWKNVLFINDLTGVIDISVSPKNPNVLYAASWERMRKAWDFDGDGNNSAIYKSTDAGTSWRKVTTKGKGFPVGDGVGRIGIASFNDDVVYAFLDNQFRRPVTPKKKGSGIQKDDFKTMSVADFMKLDNKQLNTYLRSNRFDRKETATAVKAAVKKGTIKPSHLATYLEDANSRLFDSPVIGAEVYKSTNGGKTWKKTHKEYLDGVYSSYGYYFGIIGVSAIDQNKIYIGGVPLLKSDDGGKTFSNIGGANMHSDHQALWVNPNRSGHIVNGNDGGINITFDDGKNWSKNNPHAVGQFYAVNVDNKKPYNVYGGLQDNGVWYGPSNYRFSKGWQGRGSYPYKSVGGGDGMQVQIDSRDNETVYSGSQFGYYYRVNLKTGKRISIHPKHVLGDSPYRYNWQTPILLSPHNQDILYMGANKLLRSMDQGATFQVISSDLTLGGKKGNVPYGTLASISESPFQFGLIYTGSDDGLIHLTKDGGNSWEDITGSLPKNLWVSRVVASKFKKERVYATLNGYRSDDFSVYVFMSENYGKTWKNISGNIPTSAVNVIKEDSENEPILYVGTDNGLYASFNNGAEWHPFSNGIPNVAVHDLVIQEREKDLIVGTHGRSIYKADISYLQKFNQIREKDTHVSKIKNSRFSSRWGRSWSQWSEPFTPEITIPFYSKSNKKVTVNVYAGAVKVNSFSVNADQGFNETIFDVSFSKKGRKAYAKSNPKAKISKAKNGAYYLLKGKYTVKIEEAESSFEIK